jgi:flagellar hook-length control protein FliK
MNTGSQAVSAPINPSQNPLLAVSTTNGQQVSKTDSKSIVSEPFAELLENLFVNAGNASEIGINRMIPSNGKSGKADVNNDSDGGSKVPSGPRVEKTNDERGTGLDYSGLLSMVLGIMQPTSPMQSSDRSVDAGGSISKNSNPLVTKIEQRLAALLATSQNPIAASLFSKQPTLLPEGGPSKTVYSGNDFLSLLSMKAAGNPVAKEDLLELFSDASNSSANKNTSAEVEKILTELSSSGTKLSNASSQTDASQKIAADNSQYPAISQKFENPTDLSAKILAAGNSSIAPGNKSMEHASVLQSTASSSNPAVKVPVAHDNQSITVSGNASQSSDKTGSKISAVAGKEGSQKSGYDSANLIKQNGSEIYQSISTDPKVDPRFKQELTTAVESKQDVPLSKPDISQVAQTVIREAKMMTQENKTVVNVRLEPESLGSVTLRVASDNGKLSAEFNVKTSDAQAYLETSIPQMKQMLQSNGISLSHLSVSLSGGDSQTKHQQSPAKKNSQRFLMEMESDPADTVRTFGYNTMELKV